jgi:hypothetical protein
MANLISNYRYFVNYWSIVVFHLQGHTTPIIQTHFPIYYVMSPLLKEKEYTEQVENSS